MFSLSNFIRTGLVRAVGRMADYQIILNAAGWHDKGVLTVEDLAMIQAAIDAQYAEEPEAEEAPEEMPEEIPEEMPEESAEAGSADEPAEEPVGEPDEEPVEEPTEGEA